MSYLKSRVITEEEAKRRSVVTMAETMDWPVFKGDGNINYSCGACGKLLADHMASGQIVNIVVKCKCGAFSEIST